MATPTFERLAVDGRDWRKALADRFPGARQHVIWHLLKPEQGDLDCGRALVEHCPEEWVYVHWWIEDEDPKYKLLGLSMGHKRDLLVLPETPIIASDGMIAAYLLRRRQATWTIEHHASLMKGSEGDPEVQALFEADRAKAEHILNLQDSFSGN